jgi:hypothetical protein
LGKAFDKLLLSEAIEKEVEQIEKFFRAEGNEAALQAFLSLSEKDKRKAIFSEMLEDRSKRDKIVREAAGPNEPAVNFSLNVQRNKVSEKREQSFYVDIRPNGLPGPSPFDITFDEAGIWLEYADYALHIAERLKEPSNC